MWIFVREKDSAVPFEVLSYFIGILFVAILFSISKCNTNNFIFAHQELRIWKGLSESLEIIGAHVFIRQNIEILILAEEAVHFLDNEFFVFSKFGFDLGEGDQFISLGFRHQQWL